MPSLETPNLKAALGKSPFLAVVQLGLLALLIYACARVIVPFVGVLLWSAILAVMLYPLHLRLSKRITNRWSAVLIGVVGIALLIAPMIALGTSLATSLSHLITGLQNHTLTLPPPPPKLASLPLVGERITDAWTQAATNMPATLQKHGPTLKGLTASLVAFTGKLAAAELQFILSLGIAAVLIAYGESVTNFARRLVTILTSSAERGVQLVALVAATIRGVAVGVVGVATVQAVLLGAALFVVGIPGAGLLTLAFLFLGIIQIPAVILALPIVAYAFVSEDVVTASVFAVWMIVAGLSDNVLKPLMLGRGLEVPMPVILIGVIGGMLADGLLGLFVGPALLAVAYVLFVQWLDQQPAKGEPKAAKTAP